MGISFSYSLISLILCEKCKKPLFKKNKTVTNSCLKCKNENIRRTAWE